MSSGATLVAGVGVLLLAIGLGVLIGHYGKGTSTPKTSAAAAPEVITVQGGGGSSSAAARTTTAPSAPASTKAPKHVNSASLTQKAQAKLKATTASKAVQQKATAAAGKVLGSSSNNLPPPTSTVGSKCSNTQAGCQGGKFTGNFFGGG